MLHQTELDYNNKIRICR